MRFVQTASRAIDPGARAVQTDAGAFEADVLVVALGADLDPDAIPGLAEGGHVVVGVLSHPYKCPPPRVRRPCCSTST